MYEPPSAKQTRTQLKTLIIITLALLIGVTGLILYAWYGTVMGNLQVESYTPEDVAIAPETVEQVNRYNDQIKNLLLIGIDSDQNKGEPQRSDSMIIVSVDDKHQSIKLTSLMRDTLVEIDGYGKEKLNHAYAYGGAKLLLKTINQNFNLNLVDYALVDFNDLIAIIDAVGGIDLYVTWQEAMYTNFNIENINELNGTDIEKLEIKTQNVRLNGSQALSYSRIRYLDSDYKRSERQRIVLLKIYERTKEIPMLSLPGVVMDLSGYVKTSLSEGEILDLARKVLGSGMKLHGLHFPTFQTSEESTRGSWHIEWERSDTIRELHDWIFNDIDPYRKKPLQEIQQEKTAPGSTAPDNEP